MMPVAAQHHNYATHMHRSTEHGYKDGIVLHGGMLCRRCTRFAFGSETLRTPHVSATSGRLGRYSSRLGTLRSGITFATQTHFGPHPFLLHLMSSFLRLFYTNVFPTPVPLTRPNQIRSPCCCFISQHIDILSNSRRHLRTLWPTPSFQPPGLQPTAVTWWWRASSPPPFSLGRSRFPTRHHWGSG